MNNSKLSSKSILLINGSIRADSSTQILINKIEEIIDKMMQISTIQFDLSKLPMFNPDQEKVLQNESINQWYINIKNCIAVVIVTPEYLNSIPSVLKNSLEWMTTSGAFNNKKILPIVYTPKSPRGENAQAHLIKTLQALNANIITTLLLHHDECLIENKFPNQSEGYQLIYASLKLLKENI